MSSGDKIIIKTVGKPSERGDATVFYMDIALADVC